MRGASECHIKLREGEAPPQKCQRCRLGAVRSTPTAQAGARLACALQAWVCVADPRIKDKAKMCMVSYHLADHLAMQTNSVSMQVQIQGCQQNIHADASQCKLARMQACDYASLQLCKLDAARHVSSENPDLGTYLCCECRPERCTVS